MTPTIHSSSPGMSQGAGGGVTSLDSLSFSPPANSLIMVAWGNGSSSLGFSSITDSLSDHLEWRLYDSVVDAAAGSSAVWVADCLEAQTNMHVTIGFTAREGEGQVVGVVVFTGARSADVTVANGGHAHAAAGTGNASVSATPHWSNSLMFAIIENGGSATEMTLTGDLTRTINGHAYTKSDAGSTSRHNLVMEPTPTVVGNAVTISTSGPSSAFTITEVEIPDPPPSADRAYIVTGREPGNFFFPGINVVEKYGVGAVFEATIDPAEEAELIAANVIARYPRSYATAVIRNFPFYFDTDDILTGASVYTPVPYELLLDAWVQVDTLWDGTTPLIDVGPFEGGNKYGWWGFSGTTGVRANLADDFQIDDATTLGDRDTNSSDYPSLLSLVQLAENPVVSGSGLVGLRRVVPAVFKAANPIKVVVSQDGTNTGADPGSTQGAAMLYLVTAKPV